MNINYWSVKPVLNKDNPYMDINYRGGKLHFCETVKGQAAGLVQMVLSDNIKPTVRMEISSGTTVSGKGVHSAVIKLTVPYVAITETATGSWSADAKKAASITLHTVVNIPKQVVNDLLGLNGSVPQEFAAKQLAATMDLFRSVLPVQLGGGFATTWLDQDEGQDAWSELQKREYVTALAADGTQPKTIKTVKVGDNVVDAKEVTPVDTVSGPFARILQRMAPIDCDGIDVPNAVYL